MIQLWLLSGALKHLEIADWFPYCFLAAVLAWPLYSLDQNLQWLIQPENNSLYKLLCELLL